MRGVIAAAAALIAMALAEQAIATECRDDPKVVEQCFRAHGRLRVTASLLVELWPVGSNRLFSVLYGGNEPYSRYLPKNVIDRLTSDNVVFGDFEICPFEHDRPGHMRDVCIQSASHLVVRDR